MPPASGNTNLISYGWKIASVMKTLSPERQASSAATSPAHWQERGGRAGCWCAVQRSPRSGGLDAERYRRD